MNYLYSSISNRFDGPK